MRRAKLDENALYWRSINQHKAYIIRAYVLRYGSIKDAAEALGVSYHCLRKELIRLRDKGFIEKSTEEEKTSLKEVLDEIMPGKAAPAAQEKDDGGDEEADSAGDAVPAAAEGGDESSNGSAD